MDFIILCDTVTATFFATFEKRLFQSTAFLIVSHCHTINIIPFGIRNYVSLRCDICDKLNDNPIYIGCY